MKKRKAQTNCSYLTASRGGSEHPALTALSVTKIDLPQQILRVLIPVLRFLSYHTFIFPGDHTVSTSLCWMPAEQLSRSRPLVYSNEKTLLEACKWYLLLWEQFIQDGHFSLRRRKKVTQKYSSLQRKTLFISILISLGMNRLLKKTGREQTSKSV